MRQVSYTWDKSPTNKWNKLLFKYVFFIGTYEYIVFEKN